MVRRVAVVPGAVLVVVSHDSRIIPYADRVLHLEDGRLGLEGGVGGQLHPPQLQEAPIGSEHDRRSP